MPGHAFWSDWSTSDPLIADPGTAKALPNSRSGYIPIITGASGETNTLADPTRVGLELTITLLVDGGGDRVITAATAIIGNANTVTLTLADAGDTVILRSVHDGISATRWMLMSAPGMAGSVQAADVGIADTGGFTSATTVEAAFDEIYTQLFTSGFASVPINLNSFREVTSAGAVGNIAAIGGVLASDTTPILGADANEQMRIAWAASNNDIIATSISLPGDLDGAANVSVVLQVLSAGTTNNPSFDVLTTWDGNIQVTDTAAASGTANVLHTISATVAAADVPADPFTVSIQLVPAAHTTDIWYLYGAGLRYARQIQTP